jgi:hypothetical protein
LQVAELLGTNHRLLERQAQRRSWWPAEKAQRDGSGSGRSWSWSRDPWGGLVWDRTQYCA